MSRNLHPFVRLTPNSIHNPLSVILISNAHSLEETQGNYEAGTVAEGLRADCPWRGHVFCSQRPCWMARNHLELHLQGTQCPLPGSQGTCTQKTHTDSDNPLIKLKSKPGSADPFHTRLSFVIFNDRHLFCPLG